MSELQRRIQKRDLKRKAKVCYRAMKDSLHLEHMLLRKITEIDQRGDQFWSHGQYEHADGWGFRLLNEDEILTGQAFPIEAEWIAKFATNNRNTKKPKRSRKRTNRGKCISTQRDALSVKHHTKVAMPDDPPAKSKVWTAENFVKAILILSLIAWFCAFCLIMLEL